MFFKLHELSNIGLKRLSDADLGQTEGNQTHIGLYEDTFNFISDYTQYNFAELIYEDTTEELLSFLDPIQNPDGTYRSPKIRSASEEELMIGENRINSVVRRVREITSNDIEKDWYLLWFGLKNESLVFFLIKENSLDYFSLENVMGNIPNRKIFTGNSLKEVVLFVNNKVNKVSTEYLEELEIAVQTNNLDVIKKRNRKKIDLEKARQTGLIGEEIVNKYLERQVELKKIKEFVWMNKEFESYEPYDFVLIDNNDEKFYIDAKSTLNSFQNNIYFSQQELKFINKHNNYQIYRVFEMNTNAQLQICSNMNTIAKPYVDKQIVFDSDIRAMGMILNTMKLEVPPTLNRLNFIQVNDFHTA